MMLSFLTSLVTDLRILVLTSGKPKRKAEFASFQSLRGNRRSIRVGFGTEIISCCQGLAISTREHLFIGDGKATSGTILQTQKGWTSLRNNPSIDWREYSETEATEKKREWQSQLHLDYLLRVDSKKGAAKRRVWTLKGWMNDRQPLSLYIVCHTLNHAFGHPISCPCFTIETLPSLIESLNRILSDAIITYVFGVVSFSIRNFGISLRLSVIFLSEIWNAIITPPLDWHHKSSVRPCAPPKSKLLIGNRTAVHTVPSFLLMNPQHSFSFENQSDALPIRMIMRRVKGKGVNGV